MQYILPILQKIDGTVKQQGRGNPPFLWGEKMEIKGKVHCFFEQSGTFKNEFIKLGISAEDYDIQNNFGQTDNVIDLFSEIDKEYAILQKEREREREQFLQT